MANPLKMIFGSRNDRVLRRIKKTVKKINALEESLKGDTLRVQFSYSIVGYHIYRLHYIHMLHAAGKSSFFF